MIDRFAAMKALSALHDEDKHHLKEIYAGKPLVIDCNTDTNDSYSGVDSEEDSGASCAAKDLQNNNAECQDPSVMKRERRRERNKLSAQSYRQRRRQQTSVAQKTLESLEAHNKALLEKVRQLEAEKHIVEDYLRSCVRVPWSPQKQTTAAPPCTSAETNSNLDQLNASNNNININTSATNKQDMCCTQPCSSTPACALVPSTSGAGSFSSFVAPGPSSFLHSGLNCNINKPDNFRFYPDECKAEPLNMVMEKNNNMPLRMSGVSMATEGRPVS